MPEIPFRERESETLEFKGNDALRDPAKNSPKDLFSIGREVVAMLNAKGGEIWVGLKEKEGIAVDIEPIEKPELERQRLRDYLVDSIEPRLSTEEVRIDEVADEKGQIVLRLLVSPREQARPYALLKQTGRHFFRRFGDRVVTMSREEIQGALAAKGAEEKDAALKEALQARHQVASEREPRLWLRIKAIEQLDLDLGAQRLNGFLMNPRETGPWRAGPHFAVFTRQNELLQGRVVVGDGQYSRTEITRDGAITSWVSLKSLSEFENGHRVLGPGHWIDYPVSVLRLARAIYEDQGLTQAAVGATLVDFAIFGLAGYWLKPRSPLYWDYHGNPGKEFKDATDFVLPEPLRVTLDELRDSDRVAFRLLRQLYEAFGYYEEDIPPEFDRKTGRLVIPE